MMLKWKLEVLILKRVYDLSNIALIVKILAECKVGRALLYGNLVAG